MSKVKQPSFTDPQVIHRREDGYWIERFYYKKDDKAPGLIVSGLKGEIEYLENPYRKGNGASDNDSTWVEVAEEDGDDGQPSSSSSEGQLNGETMKDFETDKRHVDPQPVEWKSYKIRKLDTPVPLASMDITGDGYNDLIVGYEYGETMINCNPTGGVIAWLENPRDNPAAKWKEHFIGRWPAMHRLATGYFTQRSFPEIIAAPVVHGPFDKSTPVPLICFQKPDDNIVTEVKEWRKDIVDDGHFRVVHEIYKKSLDGPRGLDSLLVASMDGVDRLYHEEGRWKREHIADGEAPTRWQRENNFFPAAGDLWGAGTADAGKVGSNPFAYVAVNEPFHGPYVSLYTRRERGQPGNPWKRHLLDVYGTPTQKRCWGDGPVHNLVCADIDGDGDDEFLVSMFGPVDRKPNGETPDEDVTGRSPNKGIWCYKVIDLEKGLVAKWHISSESSARCTVGNFTGKGRPDLASISYHVEGYYREKDPQVIIHPNKNGSHKTDLRIMGTLWGEEGLVYLPRPEDIKTSDVLTKELVDVAGYSIRVEVHPPGRSVSVGQKDGIKVLFGSLHETHKDKKEQVRRRPLGGPPFPHKESLTAPTGTHLQTDKRKGAILLRLKGLGGHTQWPAAEKVPVKTKFDLTDQGIDFPKLKFRPVGELWWGEHFKGVDFYNMTGFHFRLQDNGQNICHMQFWTAGPGVEAEYHDHHDNAFKELHTCLSQGTPDSGSQLGGMRGPVPSTCPSVDIQSLSLNGKHPGPPPDVIHCDLRPLEEHGRMWHQDQTGNAVYRKNNTVSYPLHEWAAGKKGEAKSIDVWMALEFDAWLDFDL